VLIAARARRRAGSRSGAIAFLFEDIYCARTPTLPDSVSDALVALSLAHQRRLVVAPGAERWPVQDARAAEAALMRSPQPRASAGYAAQT
jgi:hypothetical protein